MIRLEERIAACERLLLSAARDAGMSITGDLRVSESDAATLLCLSAGGLKHLRHEGAGPDGYRAGVGGSRWSYRLEALARWVEERHETASNGMDLDRRRADD